MRNFGEEIRGETTEHQGKLSLQVVYEILFVITPLVIAPYVARVLGTNGVGVYSFTLSNMTYFNLQATLGNVDYGIREIARHRDNPEEESKLFWEIEIVTLITTGACMAGAVIRILVVQEYKLCYIALLPQVLAAVDVLFR